MADALYHPDGDRLVPTELTRGPWDPGAQHGGPVAALCARAVEACPAPGPMQLARITVELFRAVPIAPLTVRCDLLRQGRRLQVAEVAVAAEGREVCRARALRLRVDVGTEVPEAVTNDMVDGMLPAPEEGSRFGERGETVAGFYRAVDHRRFPRQPGRRRMAWMRLVVPLVAGEVTTPTEQVVALADAGSGISVPLDFRRYLQINPEVTVHLLRPPVPGWVGLAARTTIGGQGTGLADTVLLDAGGRLGAAHQALLVERR